MKKIVIFLISTLFLVGCASTGEGGPGERFRGKGEIVSIYQAEDGSSEVGIRTADKKHVVVKVKEPLDLFPGEKVNVNKRANGTGTVTRL